MSNREKILLLLAAWLAVGAVVCYAAIPGMKFSGVLLLALAGLCALASGLRCWARHSSTGIVLRRIFLAGLAVAVVAFAAVEGFVIHGGHSRDTGVPAAMIVLGAGVNGTQPSLALQSRIDAAEAYLQEQGGSFPVVLSGGQGEGEDISEARAMYHALTADGIDSSRLILEERSTTTAENFHYAVEALAQRGVNTTEPIAVVTNDFHLFRARLLAGNAGIAQVLGVPARLPWWWLSVNYYVREVFALGKMALLSL